MDYEKKYNEALNWMRELYPGLHGATKEDAEHYFPELRESEDERIRKELIEFIREAYSTGNAPEKCAKWLVWLDLQKEQKPLIKKGVWKPSHNTLPIEQQVEAAIEKQVEAAMIAIRGEMPSKSQEWSEDDEDNLKAIIRIIEDNDSDWKELTDWLKSFPERLSLQPKQEWSEEDEKIRKTLLDYYEKALDNYSCVEWLNGITYGELCDWLKSLRPSWKPSEDEERLINTSISFLKDFADKGYENAVECIDWLKSKLNGNTCK